MSLSSKLAFIGVLWSNGELPRCPLTRSYCFGAWSLTRSSKVMCAKAPSSLVKATTTNARVCRNRSSWSSLFGRVFSAGYLCPWVRSSKPTISKDKATFPISKIKLKPNSAVAAPAFECASSSFYFTHLKFILRVGVPTASRWRDIGYFVLNSHT